MRSGFGDGSHLGWSVAALVVAACASGAPSPPANEQAATLVIPPLEAGSPAPAASAKVIDEPGAPASSASPAGGPAIGRRDERTARRRPRVAALLQAELSGLKQLLAATAKGAPDRPLILRRIAEDAVELSRAGGAPGARKEAIAAYAALVAEAPTYPQLDEVRYYLGLEHELDGDFRNARVAYYELIRSSPSSKYIPGAYFAFGEMFFDEGASEPVKNDLAEQAYRQVLQYPAPTNPLYADALLRTGQIHERKGDPAKASSIFDRLKREFPKSEAATSLVSRASRATGP